MKQKLLLYLTPVFLGFIFLSWWFSTPQVLQRRSAEIIDCIRMEEGTGRVQRAYKADKLRDLITNTITVEYPEMENTFRHRRANNEPITIDEHHARSALLYLTEIVDWITIENESIKVEEYTDDKARLNIQFTLTAKLRKREAREVNMRGNFEFRYSKNRWLLKVATFE